MTSIERREEGALSTPDYSGRELTEAEVARGVHRRWVGGHWDTGHGANQRDYLVDRGMRPEHRVLDVGCGSFRAGMHFVDYLDAGNYYGVDANQSVMQAGYDHELTDEQRAKLPVGNLRANDRFDADFGVRFDMALAQSVFTHVSLNHVRLCLYRVAQVMEPGGRFYATFFEENAKEPLDHIRVSKRAQQRFSERNVFWYYRSDLKWAASFSPWSFRYIGDWGHPAGQKMVEFTRVEAKPAQKTPAKPAAKRAPAVKRPPATIIARGRRWAARKIAPR